MPSLTSDGVETVRASIENAGALDRPKLVLPDGTIPEDIVRIVANETTYHAPVDVGLGGELELRGLYDNTRIARSGDGENHLDAWVETKDLEAGRSVLVDVIVEDEQYGLRAPGERAIYQVTESPDDSLASIAEDVDG